ncbi:MAG: hypothetical protein LBV51_04125 [Acholeplasmatales bacterium]|jgi:hypothetical protein|nr:hypothetical protein [Acholeplasmatales bacterium]
MSKKYKTNYGDHTIIRNNDGKYHKFISNDKTYLRLKKVNDIPYKSGDVLYNISFLKDLKDIEKANMLRKSESSKRRNYKSRTNKGGII